MSQVHEVTGVDTPFWIVAGGGKFDVTIKWWSHERYQEVVNAYRDRILFVQVGQQGHWHPKLHHAMDLRGRTDIRQLVRLVYHAQGILCGVTFLMHLAAAVPPRPGRPSRRPCVVVAGGREPAHWETYPGHQFIHTIGALPCCEKTGCWKTRTTPLFDGDPRDVESKRCERVVNDLPQCMDMINSAVVQQRIDLYFQGEVAQFLNKQQATHACNGIEYSQKNRFDEGIVHASSVRLAIQSQLKEPVELSSGLSGRGIICTAGNDYYFNNALISLIKLRATGSRLPVELWVGRDVVISDAQQNQIEASNLEIHRVESDKVPSDDWRFKAHGLYHSRFRHAIVMDADVECLTDPEALFELELFKHDGLLAWKDAARISGDEPIWKWFDLPPESTPMLDTGFLVMDREKHWPLTCLYRWLAKQGAFFEPRIGGNGCFGFAIHKTVKAFPVFEEGEADVDGNLIYRLPGGSPVFRHCCARRPYFQRFSMSATTIDVRQTEDASNVMFRHGFPNQYPMDESTQRRNQLAERTWRYLSRVSPWMMCSIGYEVLPRLFRDGGRRLFFLKDVLELLMADANEGDVIVLTNADACLSKNVPQRLRSVFKNTEACYSARRDFLRLREPLEDHQIREGRPYPGVDLVAFKTDWWRRNKDDFPDLLLGAEAWDWCFRALVQSTVKDRGAAFDDLVYHEVHESFWCRNGNQSLLLSQRWNRSQAKPFLQKMGQWPTGGVGWD
jgi:hypothetical protein